MNLWIVIFLLVALQNERQTRCELIISTSPTLLPKEKRFLLRIGRTA